MNESSYPQSWLDKLINMTRSHKSKTQGFRNYYSATRNNPDHAVLEQMVKAGLVKKYMWTQKMDYYHATVKGCKAIGMSEIGIKRAMSGFQ